jgi:hypothetical protein
MSNIDKYLVDRFNVNFCEDYTRKQLQLYAKRKHIFVNNPTKKKLCIEIRREDFLTRFWKNHNITRFRGFPYHIYLSLLYLRSRCIPNVDIFVPNYIEGNLTYNDLCITWEIHCNSKRLNIPQTFYNFLYSSKQQFVVIILGQSSHTQNNSIINGHANLLVFDRVNKTIERFEPHGVFSPIIYFPYECDSIISSVFLSYKYLPTIVSCPLKGPQHLQHGENKYKLSDPGGFCVMWVVWYVELKFTYHNNNLSSSKFLDMYLYIIKDIPLTMLIRKYSEHVLLIGENVRSKIVSGIYKY